MKLRCEILVWYVIPAIRSALSKELLGLGMTQTDISRLLDITQPAVSQYLTNKRGNDVELGSEIRKIIHELAIDISEGKLNKTEINSRITQVYKQIKREDMCIAHKKFGGAPKNCKICLEK